MNESVEVSARSTRASAGEDVALIDLLDRLLGGGVVLAGDITLAVADIDLVYVGTRNRVVFGSPDLDALRAAIES